MQNVYTPADVQYIMERSLGEMPTDDAGHDRDDDAVRQSARHRFITAVGRSAASEISKLLSKKLRRILIIAGDDLCGAYGLATAIELNHMGLFPSVLLFNIGGDMLSEDTVIFRDEFLGEAGDEFLEEVVKPGVKFAPPEMSADMIVVDALFGREYSKPLRGGYQAIARSINAGKATVVSLDLPSGMTLELSVGMINYNIVHADLTLTFVGPTLAFYMPENAELLGRWKVLDAPYNRSAMRKVRCTTRVIDAAAVRMILPRRNPYASKADQGNVQLFAGSYGMLGAAVLCTRAATRSGCGRVTICTPRCGFYVMQSSVPSAMFMSDGSDFELQRFELKPESDAVGVGPGMGHSETTAAGLEQLLKACYAQGKPLVIDADGLNCIASSPGMLEFVPPRSVLTPHAGEFDRLFGARNSHSTRLLKALEVAANYKIIIVLKGHYTFVVWPDGSVLVNGSGTEALATPGSGDVLTGLMTGFIAQSISPEAAAIAAVYIHGIAGRIAARSMGIYGTTAEDIADAIGPAIEAVLHNTDK